MIDRNHLRYFLAVVDHGSFSAAARHMRITQPSLSIGIARLEEQLGQRLFLRTNRRVALTSAGARLVPRSRKIETEFLKVKSAMEATPDTVAVGISSTLPSAWIGAAIMAVRQEAGARLEVVEARPHDLGGLLSRGRIQAAIGPLATPEEGTVLFEEPFLLALPADHRLARQECIVADEVAGETMFVRRHCEALTEVSQFFTARGVRPFMAARTTSEDLAAAYLRAGLGITVMPRSLGGPGIATLPLVGFHRRREIGLTVDQSERGRGVAELMGDVFRRCAADLETSLAS